MARRCFLRRKVLEAVAGDGSPAELPCLGDVDADFALLQVFADVGRLRRSAEEAVVVVGREVVDFDDFAAEFLAAAFLRVVLFLDDGDAGDVRQLAYGLGIVEVFIHHDEFDGVSADSATEAFEGLPRG